MILKCFAKCFRKHKRRPRSKQPNRWMFWYLPERRRKQNTPLSKLQWRKDRRNYRNGRLWLAHKQFLANLEPQP